MEQIVNKEKIDSLTGLRFWMMVIIVLSHFGCLSNDYPYSSFYDRYLDNAVMGVDFFFMMSGFGLMYSYGSDKISSIKGGGTDLQLIELERYIQFI